MINEGVCKYCSEVLRANGSDKFNDLANAHFRNKHPNEYKQLFKLREDAQKEFEELNERYPQLYFSFSRFQIDWDKLLSKR